MVESLVFLLTTKKTQTNKIKTFKDIMSVFFN